MASAAGGPQTGADPEAAFATVFSTGGEEDVPLRSVSRTLSALADHSKGRRLATRSRRIFIRDLQISILVGSWVVLLSLPVIVWPLGEAMWNFGCVGLSMNECAEQSICLWQRTFALQGSCVTKRSGYLRLWGTMILQFVFSVYVDYGSTVKLTVQGALGTALACLNLFLLNGVLGSWLGGGAYADATRVPQHPGSVNSNWLPLCNDGFSILAAPDARCFFNILWSECTFSGLAKTTFIWIDFIVFVIGCLALGFDTNTRMFALTTHVYLMMSFVDPSKDDFAEFPPISAQYMAMIMLASVAAILCFRFPHRRFTALEMAEELTAEATPAVGLLIESLPGVTTTLMRQKATSALEETEVVLEDLKSSLENSWFEDFGWGSTARKRRRMRRWETCLRGCIAHIPSVYHAAAALSPPDVEALVPQLALVQETCLTARNSLTAPGGLAHSQLESILEESAHGVSESFQELRSRISPEARAFLFTLHGVIADVRSALEHFEFAERTPPGMTWTQLDLCDRFARFFNTVRKHFGIELFSRSATHPRFVLRTTLSISLAFALGWGGLWNVMPAYSSYAASTMAVIVYTYTGSSAPLTVKRVAGVVLGKVMGTIIQLTFACKMWWKAAMFGICMFFGTSFMFFLYLHADRDMAYVCCLCAAYAASSMIPGSFMLRDYNTQDFGQVGPSLLKTIICTVLGVGVLSLVDLLLGSKATNQARQRLLRLLDRARRPFSSASFVRPARLRQDLDAIREDLDALRELLPYAAAEPTYWRKPFKLDLYQTLELRLRAVHVHMETLAWATRHVEPQLAGYGLQSAAGGSSFATVEQVVTREHSRTDSPQTAEPSGQDGWAPALNEAVFRPLMGGIRREVVAMLLDVANLARVVTQGGDKAEDAEAVAEIRRELESTLYSVRAVRLVASGASAAAGYIRQGLLRPQRRSADDASEDGRTAATDAAGSPPGGGLTAALRRALARLRNQVVNEGLGLQILQPLQEGVPSRSATFAELDAERLPLEDIFRQLRAESASRCAAAPHIDDLCRVELIVFLVNSIVLEVGKMQLALLEY